jgi:FKBP-type peptidyl-prolyl cis-trans isomerase FklB
MTLNKTLFNRSHRNLGWTRHLALTGLALVFVTGSQAQDATEEAPKLETRENKISYSIGVNIGNDIARSFERQGVEVDPVLLSKGILHALSDTEKLLSQEEMTQLLNEFQQEMRAKMAAQTEKKSQSGDMNKKAGEDYLAANRKREGVVSLPSGLQYEVVTAGSGKSPAATDTVVVHYKGTLIDGKEFDSSYKRGQPATFPVNGVIKGWTEALQLMKEGAKWKLFIPADLAYGSRGAGADIGPNSALVFEVELIEVKGQ